MKPSRFTLAAVVTLSIPLVLSLRTKAHVNQAPQDRNAKHRRYKLVDIGTFGGPESFINPAFTFGSHNQIASDGTVVGGAATSAPTSLTSNGFVCGGLDGIVPFVNHGFQWRQGDLKDLNALADDNNCSVAKSINAHGEISGTSENGVIDPALGVSAVHAVVWKQGEIKDLGTLGGADSNAGAINDHGQVVGFAFNAVPDPLSLIYFGLVGVTNGTQTRAYLWENGVMHDLNTLGGPDAVALFVNERGQVAGFSYTDSTSNPVTPFQPGIPTVHPFVWTRKDGMKDLGSIGGTIGYCFLSPCESGDFNNRGQLVALATTPGDQGVDPFFWDGEKMIDLFTNTIGGNPVSADALNDTGEIVGAAVFPNHPTDAYLWKNGQATDLGTVDGDGCSWAHAINSKGQVVGQSFACDVSTLHTFLWENGSMVDLNSLIPANSNLQLVDTRSINDRGEIAGIGLPPDCALGMDTVCGHAFVLIPCDNDVGDSEACLDDGAAENGQNKRVESRSMAQVPAQIILPPNEIRDRIRGFMFPRRRRFGAFQQK
jgi:probable HAF family extracellular repeat protein